MRFIRLTIPSRRLLAYLIAPSFPVLIGCTVFQLVNEYFFMIAFLISYTISFALGLPLVSLLESEKLLNVKFVVLCGACIGPLGMLCISLLLDGWTYDTDVIYFLFAFGWIFSFTVTLPFCWIAGIPWQSSKRASCSKQLAKQLIE